MDDEPLPLHYEALGVPETATLDAIRAAWREIARTSHPDRVGSDPSASARFTRASDAWAVLRDEGTRAAYDAQLAYARIPRCARCGQPNTASSSLYCSLCALATVKPPPEPGSRTRPRAARARTASPPPSPPPPPEPQVDPFRGETREHRARREAEEQRIYDRTRVFDDINEVHAPSGDNLLEALLADAALRAGPPKKKSKSKKKTRFEVQVSPHFTVALEGDAAETLDGVNTNLRLANRLMKSISRFFGR